MTTGTANGFTRFHAATAALLVAQTSNTICELRNALLFYRK
jgi:hypothetical protein